MPGIGFSYHPDVEPTKENEQIHLWKQTSKDVSETYCGAFSVDSELSAVTQFTKSTIETWAEQEDICDDCVESVKEQYY
jgi:hypothetical protein